MVMQTVISKNIHTKKYESDRTLSKKFQTLKEIKEYLKEDIKFKWEL
jgi:hypothetical protein